MFESTMVRFAVVIYSLFAFFALFLLWENAAAPDALKNSGILVASILPVLIIVLPYINPQEKSDRFNLILLYDSKSNSVTTGDSPNSYDSIYIHMFTNLSKIPSTLTAESISDFYEKGLNIVEKGIVETLMLRFISHWDVIWRESHGPNYVTQSSSGGLSDESKIITIEQIRKIFEHNNLIATPGIIVGLGKGLHLPPDSKIRTSHDKNARVITLSTKYSTVIIDIHFSNATVAQQGLWDVIKADPENLNRYYTIGYQVSLAFHPKRLKQFAPEMESYVRWYENIKDSLARFDWMEVDKRVEHSAMRKAISKALAE